MRKLWGRWLRIGKVLRLPKELARHTSMETGKHDTAGAETKDFITPTKASSTSFMLICFALPPHQVLWGCCRAAQSRFASPLKNPELREPQSFIIDCRQTWLIFDPDRDSITLASRETYPLPRWRLSSKAVLYLNVLEKKDS